MPTNQKKIEEFLLLLMSNQRQINGYVLSLVPNIHDADDIMQETITTLWRKFDDFQAGTNFAGWGMKVAYYCVLNFRKKKAKDKLVFSEDLMTQIHDVSITKQKHAAARSEQLRRCIRKLQPKDQGLLKLRYELKQSAMDIAAGQKRSVQYVYKHLARIHHALGRCVNRAFSQGGLS